MTQAGDWTPAQRKAFRDAPGCKAPAGTPTHATAGEQWTDCDVCLDNGVRAALAAASQGTTLTPGSEAFVLENARRDCEYAYRDADGEKADPRVVAARQKFTAILAAALRSQGTTRPTRDLDGLTDELWCGERDIQVTWTDRRTEDWRRLRATLERLALWDTPEDK